MTISKCMVASKETRNRIIITIIASITILTIKREIDQTSIEKFKHNNDIQI